MKKSTLIIMALLISLLGKAQFYPTCNVVLNEQNDKTISITASYMIQKKKFIEGAIKMAAFNTIFKIGIPGFNNEQPLVETNSFAKNEEFFTNFLLKKRSEIFIKSSRMIGFPIKVGKQYKGTMIIVIYINTLKKDLLSNNIQLNTVEKEKPIDMEILTEEIQLPTIMVIPYKKDGESFKDILQNDFDKRIAVASVQEGFNQKGITTIDFEAKLNAIIRSASFEMNAAQSIDKQLIRNSGSDVYVSVDIKKDFATNGNRVALVLKAYETASGKVLASKQTWSPRFRTSAIDKLTSMAIKIMMDDFLTQISANFQKKIDNGSTIVLNVSIATDAMTDMDSELGNDQLPLSDVLRLWVKRNAHKGRYHIQGSVSESVIFDQIKVPNKDENGNTYSVNDFAFNLWDYLRSDIGIACKKRVDGNTIYITILE